MNRRPGVASSMPATAPGNKSSLSVQSNRARVPKSQPTAVLDRAMKPPQETPDAHRGKFAPSETEIGKNALQQDQLNLKKVTSPAPVSIVAVKKAARPPKYHETQRFLDKETIVRLDIDLPWHLGHRAGECYRLAATMGRVIENSALRVRAVSWGYGTHDGTLGHGNSERFVGVLKRVAAFRRDHLRQVSAGNKLSLFLTDTGRVLECGRLSLHQDGANMWTPREVSFEIASSDKDANSLLHSRAEESIKIVLVEAAHLGAYAVDNNGHVYAWGTDRYGQLGLGDAGRAVANEGDGLQAGIIHDHDEIVGEYEDGEIPVEEPLRRHDPVQRAPRLVRNGFFGNERVTKLTAGNHYVLALSASGRVFSWGWNGHGQLGLGEDAPHDSVSAPRQIRGSLESFVAVDISAGHSHSLVVAMPRVGQSDCQAGVAIYTIVFSFGCGRMGRLGNGGEEDQLEPTEVLYFRGLQATRVAAGHDHSLVSCSVGSRSHVYAFGGNVFGQLGIAQTAIEWSDMPLVVDALSGLTIATIGAGAYMSSALSGDGEVYTWGDGSYGKTARLDKRTTFVPWKIPSDVDPISTSETPKPAQTNHHVMLDSGDFVTQLSMGAHHSIALYRCDEKPDRWPKFPMGTVTRYLKVEEGDTVKFQLAGCASSYAKTTFAPSGIVLHCETCELGPVCRVCTRRCHRDHKLVPYHDSPIEKTSTINTDPAWCACGNRRPPSPSPPPRLPRANGLARQPQAKPDGASLRKPAQVDSTPETPVSKDSHELLSVYCSMASLPAPVPEDSSVPF